MENKILPQGLQVPDNSSNIRSFKITFLAIMAIIGFGITWHLLAWGVVHGEGLIFWFWPTITAAIATSFLAFLSVVNFNKTILLATSAAIFIWYMLVMPRDWFVLGGGALFFLLILMFENRIRHDETSRADFSMSRVMRGSIGIMVYALLVILGFNIYFKIHNEFSQNPQQVYSQVGHYAARGLEYVPSGLGDFDPDQRFDEFVVKQAERQEPAFEQAPQSVQEQAIEEVKKGLMDRFHIQVSGNPLLGEIVAGWAAEKVQNVAQRYQRFFPAIFALIAVALLRTLSFIFIWATELIAWGLYKLLVAVRFFKIERVQVEVDKLHI
jgi:hypothetical protein